MSSCDPSYSILWENLKYAARASYTAPAAILNMRILYVIYAKHRKIYSQSPFFIIYSMDCITGLLTLLLDIFVTRVFVYMPQLCQSGSQFFLSHTYFMEFYYPFLHYLHCTQPFIQIFLSTNRMTSVLFPVHHNQYWQPKIPFIFLFIALVPIPFIWSTIVAPKVIVYYFGGFFMIAASAFKAITRMMFILRSVAVSITILTTSIMFCRMSKMTNRLRNSERTLCVACAINSICFLIPSFVEAFATFYEPFGNSKLNYLIQPLAWDILNVGSPTIMVFVSTQLRRHVFSLSAPQSQNSSSATKTHLFHTRNISS